MRGRRIAFCAAILWAMSRARLGAAIIGSGSAASVHFTPPPPTMAPPVAYTYSSQATVSQSSAVTETVTVTHSYTYQDVLANSKKVAWTEDGLLNGRTFELPKRFLPNSLSGVDGGPPRKAPHMRRHHRCAPGSRGIPGCIDRRGAGR